MNEPTTPPDAAATLPFQTPQILDVYVRSCTELTAYLTELYERLRQYQDPTMVRFLSTVLRPLYEEVYDSQRMIAYIISIGTIEFANAYYQRLIDTAARCALAEELGAEYKILQYSKDVFATTGGEA